MKVFISWSGRLSKNVADLISKWIENVLQGTETWISSDDVEKGTFWFNEVTNQLTNTKIGIICLTKENLNAPWILFEAGSLSKGLSKNRVIPLLINLSPSELILPLSNFNATIPDKEDMLKLIKTINLNNEDKKLSEDRVLKAFDKWWEEFDEGFKNILINYNPSEVYQPRTVDNMVEEILEIVRSIKKQTTINPMSKYMQKQSSYLGDYAQQNNQLKLDNILQKLEEFAQKNK